MIPRCRSLTARLRLDKKTKLSLDLCNTHRPIEKCTASKKIATEANIVRRRKSVKEDIIEEQIIFC